MTGELAFNQAESPVVDVAASVCLAKISGMQYFIPLLLLVSASAVSAPPRTEHERQFATCSAETSGAKRVTAQEKHAACTKLLESGRLTARERSVAYILRANAHDVLEEETLSLADLSSAIRADPTYSYAWAKSCAAHNWGKRDKTVALEHCRKAVDLDSEDSGAWTHFGDVYLDQKQYKEAIKLYNRSIAINPRWMWPWVNRGVSYLRSGDTARAIKNLDQAVRLAPDFPVPYWSRGQARLKLGQIELASADFERGLRVDPQCAECIYGRSVVKRRNGDAAGAALDAATALRLDPDVANSFAEDALNLDP